MARSNGRTADHPIDPLFLDRWSPRTFTGDSIGDDDLHTIFEAARWAPSSSNLQPWRFLYAKRDGADWPCFFGLLNPGNQRWAEATAVLIAVLSKTTAPIKGSDATRTNESHSFDSGAAAVCLALQAARLGWAAHAMGGFDRPRAVAELAVPGDYRIECVVAVGRPLIDPAEPIAANGRAPQSQFVRAGRFSG